MVKKDTKTSNPKVPSFEEMYPHIAEFVETHGWIELGQIEGFSAFVMALDEGGLVWEGKETYKTLGQAFQDLEKGLAEWMKEVWGESE